MQRLKKERKELLGGRNYKVIYALPSELIGLLIIAMDI
jgi:hypothetical protein